MMQNTLNRSNVAIIIGLSALVSFFIGFIISTIHFSNDVGNTLSELSNVYIASSIGSDVFTAVITARATAEFIDEHSFILSLSINPDVKDSLYKRRAWYADRTIDMLDSAYEKLNELDANDGNAKAKIILLRSKLEEMRRLATDLRSIAYKTHLSSDDVDRAISISKNMFELGEDVHEIITQLIKIYGGINTS